MLPLRPICFRHPTLEKCPRRNRRRHLFSVAFSKSDWGAGAKPLPGVRGQRPLLYSVAII